MKNRGRKRPSSSKAKILLGREGENAGKISPSALVSSRFPLILLLKWKRRQRKDVAGGVPKSFPGAGTLRLT